MAMTPPRFQFTVRKMFLATFWVAVSMSLAVHYFRTTSAHGIHGVLWLLSLPAFLISALLAITTIFGRGTLGCWVIVAAFFLVLALMTVGARFR